MGWSIRKPVICLATLAIIGVGAAIGTKARWKNWYDVDHLTAEAL